MDTADAIIPAVPEVLVVGIGASAGGIVAMQRLFEALPAHPGLAFVVIQHLPPNHPSGLAKLIAKWTPMPVLAAVDGMRPTVDTVVVPGADQALTIEQGEYRLRPLAVVKLRPGIDTIDRFFESLAAERSARALAVVLSGTGTDGTAGAVCIRRAGGVVLVQDPATALHGGMAAAVIARGVADHVLPAAELAQMLVACGARVPERHQAAVATADVTVALDGILDLIRRQAGFDLRGYKPSPLLWRIQQRLDARRVRTFADYEALLRDDPAELEILIRRIPIHVTEFFRDAQAWEALGDTVLRPLFQDPARQEPVRAWSPACATGEEAYSLAMLLSEQAEAAGSALDFQVFASDASPEILARASRGAFAEQAVAKLDAQRRSRFLYAADGVWHAQRSLREKLVFAPQDLLADPPFSGIDVITCRNLLIYLDPEAATRVLLLLHSALRMGGCLFLGKAEALSPRQRGFEVISARHRLYRKTGPASDVKIRFPSRRKRDPSGVAVEASGHRAVIEHKRLPAVLIDERLRVLYVYGDTQGLLRLPAGDTNGGRLDMLQPGLADRLRPAVAQALAQGAPQAVFVPPDATGDGAEVYMRVTSMPASEAGGEARLLVSFERAASDDRAPQPGDPEPGHATHEELEASREELQALNEELKSANDQLNASFEDLHQSNAQLQEKIEALELQRRVLGSGEVITLFLDPELRVRWFTLAIGDLFPLIPTDAGRRIGDFNQRFADPRFIDDIHDVMRGEPVREAEVRCDDGRWFVRRVHPHLSEQRTNAGVAVTFADITGRKQAENALILSEGDLRRSEERQSFLLQLSDAMRPLADPGRIKHAAVRVLGARLGVDRAFYADADTERWLVADVYERTTPVLPEGPYAMADFGQWIIDDFRLGKPLVVRDIRCDPRFSSDKRAAQTRIHSVSSAAVPLHKDGRLVAMLALHCAQPRDWTADEITLLQETAERTWAAVERARAERALRESEGLYRALFDNTEDGFALIQPIFDADGGSHDFRMLEVNAAWERHSGLVASDFVGKRIQEITPGVESVWAATYAEVVRTGASRRVEEHYAHSGRWFDLHAFRYREGQVGVLFRDITARKHAEHTLRDSEQLYRTLFESTDEGSFVVEPILGPDGVSDDYRMIQVNAAWERQTGLKAADLVGRRIREVLPNVERVWPMTFGEVAVSGVARHFEDSNADTGRWYALHAFPHGAGRVGVLFRDITQRKRDERRRRFLLELDDALRPLTDPGAIRRAATTLLGDTLDADRTFYGDVHPDGITVIVRAAHLRRGASVMDGSFTASDFGGFAIARLQSGDVLDIPDVSASQNLSPAEKAAFVGIGVLALLVVPLIRGGRWVSVLAVTQAAPRTWTVDDLALVQDTALRTWRG